MSPRWCWSEAGQGPRCGQRLACHQCWPGLCPSARRHQLQGIPLDPSSRGDTRPLPRDQHPARPGCSSSSTAASERQLRAAPAKTPAEPAAAAGGAGAAESPGQPRWWGVGFGHGSQPGRAAGRGPRVPARVGRGPQVPARVGSGLPPGIPQGLPPPLALRGASPTAFTAHIFRTIPVCHLGHCSSNRCPAPGSVASTAL